MKMKFRKINLATLLRASMYVLQQGKLVVLQSSIYTVSLKGRLNCLLLSRKAKEVMDQHYVFEGAVLRAVSNAERLFLNQSRYSNKLKQGCYAAYDMSSAASDQRSSAEGRNSGQC